MHQLFKNNVLNAVQSFIKWQSETMGRDINQVAPLLMDAGCKRSNFPIFDRRLK